MIESIAEIGKVYKDSTNTEVWRLVIEYPKVTKILAICINTNTNTVKVYDEGDATREKIAKTLYTTPPTKGAGAAPTAKLNLKDPEKTLDDKIIRWFRKHKREDLADIISENIKAEDILELLGPKESAILTVKIDGKWPSEISWVKKIFRQTLTEKMSSGIYGGENAVSKSKGVCLICGKETVVHGFVLPWVGMNFATADKPGFFEDLDVSKAWKIIPICAECAWNIRIGWNLILEREQEYKVAGLQYLVFPSKGAESEEIKEFLENIEKPQSKFAVFSGIAEAEEIIEDIDTNIDLLVYRKEQNKMEIYLLEQNIPPGTFRKIRQRNHKIAKDIGVRKTKILPVLSAYSEILDAVFRDEKSKTKKLKELAQIIHAMIRNQNWPGKKYTYFVKYIEMNAHNKQKGLDTSYVEPLLVYIYFVGGDKVSENFNENIRFPSKTAEFAFWTGVLARHVVQMQNEAGWESGKEPFRKNIRNVRMNIHQLQHLYTQAFEKAKAYSEMLEKKSWVRWTNNIIEICSEKAVDLDTATPAEIGFFFAVGYGLYWKIVKNNKNMNLKGGDEDEG